MRRKRSVVVRSTECPTVRCMLDIAVRAITPLAISPGAFIAEGVKSAPTVWLCAPADEIASAAATDDTAFNMRIGLEEDVSTFVSVKAGRRLPVAQQRFHHVRFGPSDKASPGCSGRLCCVAGY